MAQANETILLDVKISNAQAVQNIAALKEQVDKLKQEQLDYINAQKDEDKAAAKNSETYVRLNEQIKALNVQISEQSRIVQAEAKEARNLEGSYNALSAQLAQLKSQYKAVATNEEREEILVHLKEVNDRLVELDEQQGVFVRNVGNYENSIVAAADKMHLLGDAFKATGAGSSALGKGIDSVDKTMKVMSKNPIMAVISLLAPILAKIASLVSQNQAAVEAFHKVTKPIGDLLSGIASVISNTLVAALNALESAWNKVSGFFSSVASWFGLGGSPVKQVSKEELEAARAAAEYAKQVDELTKKIEKEAKALTDLQKTHQYYLDYLKAAGADSKTLHEYEIKYLREEKDERRKLYEDANERAEAYFKKITAGKKANAEGYYTVATSEADELKRLRDEAAKYKEGYDQIVRDIVVKNRQYETDKNNEIKKKNEERRQLYNERKEILNEQLEDMRRRELSNDERAFDDLKKAEEKELAIIGLSEQDKQRIRDYYAQKRLEKQKEIDDREAAEQERKDKEEQAKKEADEKKAKKEAEDAAKEREELLKKYSVIAPDDGELENQLTRLQAALDKGIIAEEEYAQAVAELYAGIARDKAASVVDMAQQVMGIVDTISGVVEENENAQMEQYMADNEAKKEALKDRLDSGLITQAEYDNQVANLDKEQEKKKKELDLKQAKRQKAMAIMNATLNAAGAIIASLAHSPVAEGLLPNPAGIASLALATATGIAQIAAAAATPLPKASRGMLISGPSHAQGGTLIEAEGGEAIINKRATSRFLPILSRINQSTGGIPLYGSGGIVGDAQIEKAAASQQAADTMANTPIYVTVVDINEGQERLAKVVERKSY